LDDKVLLVGHDGVPDSIEAGQEVRVTFYWEALAQMEEDYTIFIHLIDDQSQVVAQHDGQPTAGFYPTSFWDEGEVIRDEHSVSVDSSIPRGEYELVAGMYLLATGDRLPVLDEQGRVTGDAVSLGTISLTEG
jgi:hypothetical protein